MPQPEIRSLPGDEPRPEAGQGGKPCAGGNAEPLCVDPLAMEAALARMLSGYPGVVVAFSGGVDSAYLMHMAHTCLGERAHAVFIDSPFMGAAERSFAVSLAGERGWRLLPLHADPLESPAVAANPPDRCYHCKRLLFTEILRVAAEVAPGCPVVDGGNVDDRGDYRPGRRALSELGIGSPLEACGFGKAAIRARSRAAGLPGWDRPSNACLASRIPYGQAVTAERLARIDRAETYLRELGFSAVRVRDHGEVARIEVEPERVSVLAGCYREGVVEALRAMGFLHVAVDLEGYATGRLNRAHLAGGSVPAVP